MTGELQLQQLDDRNPRDLDFVIDNHYSDDTEILKDDVHDHHHNNDIDVEDSYVPCYRIYLKCDVHADDDIDGELISPCMFKGTQQFVHRTCLDHWRSVKKIFAFSYCMTCKA